MAIFLDGVDYAGDTVLVAVGVTDKGYKHVLGLRHGGTENAQVVTALLEELIERGLDTSGPTLFVLDGAKALVAGVKPCLARRQSFNAVKFTSAAMCRRTFPSGIMRSSIAG